LNLDITEHIGETGDQHTDLVQEEHFFLKKVKLHVLQQLTKIHVFWCTKIYTIRHKLQMLSYNTGFAGTNDIFYEKAMVKGNFNDLTK